MIRDLRWAVRWLRKNLRFTAAIILILALGIGAVTAVFSIVYAVLLRPMAYRAPDQLVRVDETSTRRVGSGIPAQDYLEWRERGGLFEHAAAYLTDILTVTGIGEPEQVVARRVSAGTFSMPTLLSLLFSTL